MDTLILHHYTTSPFSEKVRLILGAKDLAWRSVMIPPVMPKPDVLALTGGYRRTPILQVGADVYCDSALIAHELEARAPQATLYPASAPLAGPLAQWADGLLFWQAVTVAMQPAGAAAILGSLPPEVVKAFRADRSAFTGPMVRPTLADATVALHAALARFEAQLVQAGPWLLGAARSIADFSVAHNLWFVQIAGPIAAQLEPYPAVRDWLARLRAAGHGHSAPMDSAEAVAVAAAATAHAKVAVQPGLGFAPGDRVQVAATDYGCDPSGGELVGLDTQRVVIRRQDARAGSVHVHFPRQGFQIRKETQQ